MGKNNNLQDFMADLADAIREKKGTTDKINPQDFSDEIKSIKTSTSMWTGHVDVEGLKAIGWDDEDIAYYQEHGVNWMEEDDEYHKVSDDNKALYGVLTADNIQEYKGRIVYLPKIDISQKSNLNEFFSDCKNMVAIPLLDFSHSEHVVYLFYNCHQLVCVPPIRTQANRPVGMFNYCYSLTHLPVIQAEYATSIHTICNYCYSLVSFVGIGFQNVKESTFAFADCFSLQYVSIDYTSSISFHYCCNIVHAFVKGIKSNIDIQRCPTLSKESLLYIIENEAATEPITLPLHAAAYARLSTDPDIVAALENHPLVSLASA